MNLLGRGGADASNPTAAVKYQDIRYRYFDLSGSAKKHSFETEGAYVAAPWLKIYGDAKDVVLGVESAGN